MKKIVFFSAFLALASVLPLPALGQSSGSDYSQDKSTVLEHEIQKGDNLHLIAAYYFKDPRQWRKIYDLNSRTIKDRNLILPGKVIKIRVNQGEMLDISYAEFVALVLR